MSDERVEQLAAAIKDSYWSTPRSLDKFTPPPFPLFVLPPALCRYVTRRAAAVQVAGDLVATLALGALCVPIARRYVLTPWSGRREELVVWVCSPLASSERKSEVLRGVLDPVRDQGRGIRDELRSQAAEMKAEIKMKEIAYGGAVKEAASGSNRDAKEAEKRALNLSQELAELEVQQVDANFAFVADDSTPEGLVRRLGSHPVVVLASAEGGVLTTVIGARYGEGRMNIDALNKTYTGEEVDVVRASGTKSVERPLSVQILSPQPFVIEDLLQQHGRELAEKGTLSRYLFCVVPSKVGTRGYGQPQLAVDPADIGTTYARLCGSPASKETPTELQFDAECIKAVRAVHDAAEQEAATMDERDPMRAWTLRLENHVERLAALLHLLWLADADGAGLPGIAEGPLSQARVLAVSADACVRAAALGAYFWAHAECMFAATGGGSRRGRANTLLGWILAGQRERFTVREAKRSHDRWDGDSVESALQTLQEAGYLRPDDKPAGPKGGAPSAAYQVNPIFLREGWASAKTAKTPLEYALQNLKEGVLAVMADGYGPSALLAEFAQWFPAAGEEEQ